MTTVTTTGAQGSAPLSATGPGSAPDTTAALAARLDGLRKTETELSARVGTNTEVGAEMLKQQTKIYQAVARSYGHTGEVQRLEQRLKDYDLVLADLKELSKTRDEIGLLSYQMKLARTNTSGFNGDPVGGIVALQLERTQILDKTIMSQQKDMEERNNLLKQLNTVLQDLRASRPPGKPETTKAFPPGLVKAAMDLGVKFPAEAETAGKVFTQAEWDNVLNNVKSVIDQNNNDSQIDTIRLNSMLTKRNQAFEMMSNIMTKQQQVMDNLIRKFGN